MPFSFSRLFLGKKATIIDEDSLPCQPREIVPEAVNANPVTSKTKFGLTKIGRALKHKFHLNTTHTVPAGHGPLVVVADEPFSPFTPFSRCLQSPATHFQSLPHIPDVSSTLRRDFRNATRFALLAAAEEANSLTSSNDIYISTPCRKRQTRSSSVLGGTDLPRPETPLEFESLRHSYQGYQHENAISSIPAHLITSVDSPLIWESDQISTDSSEYNNAPDVLPLGMGQYQPPVLPPFIGLAAIEAAYPSPVHDWYLQQYLQSNANWSMPVIPASQPSSSPYGSSSELPVLNFGSRRSLPSSSVYSSFAPAHDGDRQNCSKDLSPQKLQHNTYSPMKSDEQTRLFPRSFKTSPPADDAAREAHEHSTHEGSLVEPAVAGLSLHDEEEYCSASEVFYDSTNIHDDHITERTTTDRLESLIEPRPNQFLFGSVAEALADLPEDTIEDLAVLQKATCGRNTRRCAAARASSTATIRIQHPQRGTQCFRREPLVLRQFTVDMPDSILRPGAERQVQIVANGPSRFISGFDLFASEQQYGLVQVVSNPDAYLASSADNSAVAFETRLEQVSTSKPASICSRSFTYPFTPDVYHTTVSAAPSMGDMIKTPKSPHPSPQNRRVTFARVRRTVTRGGTTGEEQETENDQTNKNQEMLSSQSVDLLSKWPDLDANWHHEDQDFLQIEKHVSGYEMAHEDRKRDRAMRRGIRCLQTSLASANTRLMKITPLEQALELRHTSYLETEKQNTELIHEVSALKARVDAGKVVFDRMMSEKLFEIASKDQELDTLRALCGNNRLTEQLAELQKDLSELRKGKLDYSRIEEEYSKLLKRADDRQCRAEEEAQTARVAQTFAEMNQQSAEEYHDNLKERIVELEFERDQAFNARDCALSEARELQDGRAAHGHKVAEPDVSTTPVGSPSGNHGYQDEMGESEIWASGHENGGGSCVPTEGVTEELEEHDWDDSEIF